MVGFKYTAVAALAAGASAKLNIHNYCSVPVSVAQSHNGACNTGPSGKCIIEGGEPWVIQPSGISSLDWVASGNGVSLKISKRAFESKLQFEEGVLQFEYTVVADGGLFWDLSDLDGISAGQVGTPFRDVNVKASPTGNGEGSGTCRKIRCESGKVCHESYQKSDDANTRWCPADTGDIWLDLCQPDTEFVRDLEEVEAEENNETSTDAHARAHARHILGGHGHGHSH